MQDLSLQLEKRTPKNYQIPPKNYPRIVFRWYLINTNEYSLFKSNVYEKFKLQKRFSRSTG